MIIPRIGSCIVGYFFGCFLTAGQWDPERMARIILEWMTKQHR